MGELPPSPERTGWGSLALSSAAFMLAWLAVFYFLALRQPRTSWPKSSKEFENDKYWCARIWVGVLHSIVVTMLALPSFFVFVLSPHIVQFSASHSVAWCTPDHSEALEMTSLQDLSLRATAFAGLAFTTFTCADVIISSLHGLWGHWDYMVHHAAFIVAGVIIRSHCMLGYNASILLAMEASTPFLQYMLFFRHRGPRFEGRVTICGGIFFLLFVLFRLILNTYGALLLWRYSYGAFTAYGATDVPAHVPSWQVWFVLIAVSLGAVVQFFWFPRILKIFIRKLCPSVSSDRLEEAHEDRENSGNPQEDQIEMAALPSKQDPMVAPLEKGKALLDEPFNAQEACP